VLQLEQLCFVKLPRAALEWHPLLLALLAFEVQKLLFHALTLHAFVSVLQIWYGWFLSSSSAGKRNSEKLRDQLKILDR
jgi:hypothetical protein